MRFSHLRFTNIAILFSLLILTFSGIAGLFWSQMGWLFDLHRAAGWVLIITIPWKTAIALRSLRRGLQIGFDRGAMVVVSLFLAVVAITVVALGIAWLWNIGPQEGWLRQTLVSWHWMLGLGLAAPLAIHVWRRWPKPKKVDFVSRRAVIRVLGLGAAGLVGWRLAEALSNQRALPEAPRRLTGSRRGASFSGNAFPVTNGPGESGQPVNLDAWFLHVEDLDGSFKTYRYADLLALPRHEQTATLDCTLGWYTTQVWQGIALPDLLAQSGLWHRDRAILIESSGGYGHVFSPDEVQDMLLATHVGGEPLAAEHGYPLRAVAPSRRGWFWVKWVQSIREVPNPQIRG